MKETIEVSTNHVLTPDEEENFHRAFELLTIKEVIDEEEHRDIRPSCTQSR